MHRLGRIDLEVLQLLRFLDRGWLRGFDPEEDGGEAGRRHRVHQLRHRGQIDAGLGVQLERPAVGALPFLDARQELRHQLAVADEVVVDDEDGAAKARLEQGVQLGQHLLGRLGARHAPDDLDDVAELAAEGAAARVLDAHRGVLAPVEQVEARGRRVVQAGPLALQGREDARRLAALQGLQ